MPSSPANCSRLIQSASRFSGWSCKLGAVFCIWVSHPGPGKCRGRADRSRREGPEPRRRPELRRRGQFRPLFYWDFRAEAECGTDATPSPIPVFPVPQMGLSPFVRVGSRFDLVSATPDRCGPEEPGSSRIPAAGLCTGDGLKELPGRRFCSARKPRKPVSGVSSSRGHRRQEPQKTRLTGRKFAGRDSANSP